MRIKLVRDTFTDKSTTGKVYVDDAFECFSLEDVDRKLELGNQKIPAQTCIPRGKYQIKLTYSSRFQKVLPELIAVRNFLGVRIHAGNTDKQTEGCILLGRTRSVDFVGESKLACAQLQTKIDKALSEGKEIWIEIV